MQKIKNALGRFLTYSNRNQLGLQSNLFWIFAIIYLGNNEKFWMFAIPAIAFRGIQTIINELRKNQK